MYSTKFNLVSSKFHLLFCFFFLFSLSSCVNKEEKIKFLCRKWVFSPNTLQKIEEDMRDHKQSPSDIKKMVSLLKEFTFEYVSTGTFKNIYGQKENTLYKNNGGQWECDDDFKQITLISDKAKEVYTIKELTENSLKLSFIQEGKEVVREYVPFIEKEPVKLKEKLDENVKAIDFQTFNYSKELFFGYIVKRDSTDTKYFFVRNDGHTKEALVKINGDLIKLKLVKEGSKGDKFFFQEYTSKTCNVRVEYEEDNSHKSSEYIGTLKSKIKIYMNGREAIYPDLYAETLSD